MINLNEFFCFNHKCKDVNKVKNTSELMYKVRFVESIADMNENNSSDDSFGGNSINNITVQRDSFDDDISTKSTDNDSDYVYFSLTKLRSSGGEYQENGVTFKLNESAIEINDRTASFSVEITRFGATKTITVKRANRVCPVCKQMIPESFGICYVHPVMMFGATSAGKTTILGGMYNASRHCAINGHELITTGKHDTESGLVDNLLKGMGAATHVDEPWDSRVLFIHVAAAHSQHVLMMCDAAGEFCERKRSQSVEDLSRSFETLANLADAIIIVRDSCSLDSIVTCYKKQPKNIQNKLFRDVLCGLGITLSNDDNIPEELKAILKIERSSTMEQLTALLNARRTLSTPRILYVLNKADILELLLKSQVCDQDGRGIFDDLIIDQDGNHLIDVNTTQIFKPVSHTGSFNMRGYCEKSLELSEFLYAADENYRNIRRNIVERDDGRTKTSRGLFAVSAVKGTSVLEPLAWLIESIIENGSNETNVNTISGKRNGAPRKSNDRFNCSIDQQFFKSGQI